MATLQTRAPKSGSDGVIPPPLQTGAPNAAATVRLPPSPRFLYEAHEERWTVISGMVIPELHKLAVEVGVNRVDSRGYVGEALLDRAKRGWRAIPEDCDGPGTSYVRAHVVGYNELDGELIPVYAHLDQFEKVFKGSAQIVEGGKRYAEWARSLIDRGIVPPPPVHVLERMAEQRETLAGRCRDNLHANPSLRGELAAHEAAIAAIRKEIELRLEPEAGEAPPPLNTAPPKPAKKAVADG